MFIWEERNEAWREVLRAQWPFALKLICVDLGTSSSRKGHMNRSIIRWGLFSLLLLSFAASSHAQVAVGISVRFGPPPIPIYAQPICPGPGYFWTPGYWAWSDDDGYYWVPGTWVVAPIGMYWTPGYWGWGGGFYAWHSGYWGPHVGFYGGINYGYGYSGVGFYGGEWRDRGFYYNRSVTNVSVTNVTNVYNRTVIVNNVNRVSYNGGQGGIDRRPSRDEERWDHERHAEPLGVQMEHEHAASRNRENFARENHGRPAFAATARPGDFSRHSVVPARAAGGEYHPPAMSPREARVNGPANRGNFNDAPRSNASAPMTDSGRSRRRRRAGTRTSVAAIRMCGTITGTMIAARTRTSGMTPATTKCAEIRTRTETISRGRTRCGAIKTRTGTIVLRRTKCEAIRIRTETINLARMKCGTMTTVPRTRRTRTRGPRTTRREATSSTQARLLRGRSGQMVLLRRMIITADGSSNL